VIASIWNRIAAIANLWTFALFVLLFFGFNVFFFEPISKNYPRGGTLDINRYGFRAEEAPAVLRAFDNAGQLDTYRKQEYGDLFFPIAYSLMCAVAITGLGKSLRVPHWLVLVPFMAAIGDYVENISILCMINHYSETQTVPRTLATIGSAGSRVKWGFLIASLLIVLVLVALRLLSIKPHAKQ